VLEMMLPLSMLKPVKPRSPSGRREESQSDPSLKCDSPSIGRYRQAELVADGGTQ